MPFCYSFNVNDPYYSKYVIFSHLKHNDSHLYKLYYEFACDGEDETEEINVCNYHGYNNNEYYDLNDVLTYHLLMVKEGFIKYDLLVDNNLLEWSCRNKNREILEFIRYKLDCETTFFSQNYKFIVPFIDHYKAGNMDLIRFLRKK